MDGDKDQEVSVLSRAQTEMLPVQLIRILMSITIPFADVTQFVPYMCIVLKHGPDYYIFPEMCIKSSRANAFV